MRLEVEDVGDDGEQVLAWEVPINASLVAIANGTCRGSTNLLNRRLGTGWSWRWLALGLGLGYRYRYRYKDTSRNE